MSGLDIFGAVDDSLFGAALAELDEVSGAEETFAGNADVFGAAKQMARKAILSAKAKQDALPTPRMLLSMQTTAGNPSATLAAVGDEATFTLQLPYKVQPRKLLIGGNSGVVITAIDIAGVAQVQGAPNGGIPGLVGSPDQNVEISLKPIPPSTPITVKVKATVAGTVVTCGWLADVLGA